MNFDYPILSQPIGALATTEADSALEIIQKHVRMFQASLDQKHDVGIMLTNFGTSVLMEVREVTASGSRFIIFKGFVNGSYSTLIQHVSQLNFLLTAIPKAEDKPKNVIGFTAN